MDEPKLGDALDAQATATRAVSLSIDYYDEMLRELRAAVLELNAKVPELEANVARLERIARHEGCSRRHQHP